MGVQSHTIILFLFPFFCHFFFFFTCVLIIQSYVLTACLYPLSHFFRTMCMYHSSCITLGLSHLCEFIEDCEHVDLATRILHLLGREGTKCAQPSKFIRFIYNRVLLETPPVRAGTHDKIQYVCAYMYFDVVKNFTSEHILKYSWQHITLKRISELILFSMVKYKYSHLTHTKITMNIMHTVFG